MKPHKLRVQSGFTLLELSFLLAVIAILSAIALPVYRSYMERAQLAEVLVQLDVMREKAAITAATSGRDLCQWKVAWLPGDGGKTLPDADTQQIERTTNEGIAALDAQRWRHDLSRFSGPGDTAAALTVQFAGVGVDGVRRVRLLAAELQRTGTFNQWEKESKFVAVFTAFLGNCKSKAVSASLAGASSTALPAAATPPASTATGPKPEKVFHFPDNPAGGPADYCKVDPGDAHNTGIRFGDACHAPCKVTPTDTQPTGFIADGQCMPLGGGRTLSDTFVTPEPDPRWGGRAPTQRYCYQCKPSASNTDICEYEYDAGTCSAPANYCVNTVQNSGGAIAVNRRCGTVADVYQAWSGKGNTSGSCGSVGPSGGTGSVSDGATCTFVCTDDRCNQAVEGDASSAYSHRSSSAPKN